MCTKAVTVTVHEETMTQKDVSYVKYVVHKYLRGKQTLEEYRDDLEQEGMMAFLAAQESYEESFGNTKELYTFYEIMRAMQRYVRREVKHFRKPEADPDSPYWDLNEAVLVEEIEQEEVEPYAMDLQDIADKLDLTGRQKEVLSVWLESGDIVVAAKKLNCSKQYVNQTLKSFISKAQELVDYQGS